MKYVERPSFFICTYFSFLRTEEHYLHIQIQSCSTSGGHLLFFHFTQLYCYGRAQTVPGTMHVFHHPINNHSMSSFVLINRIAVPSQVPEAQETISFYRIVVHDNLTNTKPVVVQR